MLVAWEAPSHKRRIVLFDLDLRARRRDRAARTGPELFLFERTFADCLERIVLVQRPFERALIVGCPDPEWPERLRTLAASVEAADPGRIFAERAGGTAIVEDDWPPQAQEYDLILAIGTLDTVNELPRTLAAIRAAMQANGLFIGAICGGDTLPQLRSAVRAADGVEGMASPHVHPRIEASAIAPLLSAAGFVMPVVDVDRVPVSYPSLRTLVSDLRAMGATNVLAERSRKPLSRTAYQAACDSFSSAAENDRTTETFEILHFAAWTPAKEG